MDGLSASLRRWLGISPRRPGRWRRGAPHPGEGGPSDCWAYPRAAAAITVPIICKAVAAADCVVLPVLPSPKDMPAQDVMSEVIDELGEGEHRQS